jgi:hypothetical protein
MNTFRHYMNVKLLFGSDRRFGTTWIANVTFNIVRLIFQGETVALVFRDGTAGIPGVDADGAKRSGSG